MITKVKAVQSKRDFEILKKLHAQIAVYSGRRVGGLSALREMTLGMFEGCLPVCGCCKRDIWEHGHAKSCPILKKYHDVFGVDKCICGDCEGE